MNIEDYKKRLEEVLTTPLATDSPEELYKQAAVIESLSYLAIKLQAEAEQKLSRAERTLREAGSTIIEFKGTASDRKQLWEASCASIFEEIDKYRYESRYWLNIGKAIEKKVSLTQSILSNISASIKAGIRLDSV